MRIKNTFIMLVLWLVVFSQAVFAILPEDVGGTQYATGHLAAAEKYRTSVKSAVKRLGIPSEKSTRYYEHLEKFLLSQGDHSSMLSSTFKNAQERKEFLKVLINIQETDRALKPPMIMIGKARGVAVDGHHRIRNIEQIGRLIKDANKLWPDEMRGLLSAVGRINSDGSPILSVDFKQVKIIEQLLEDASAEDVVRSLLTHSKGLWKDPKDQELAQSLYGADKSKKASLEQLEYLGRKLGIRNNPVTKQVEYITIADLPDSSSRTLIGRWFDSRNLKFAFNYRDYAEFYVADEIKNIEATATGKYPYLKKMLALEGSSEVKLQKEFIEGALKELDAILVNDAKFRVKLADLSKSPNIVSHALLSLHTKVKPIFSVKCFSGFTDLLLKMR